MRKSEREREQARLVASEMGEATCGEGFILARTHLALPCHASPRCLLLSRSRRVVTQPFGLQHGVRTGSLGAALSRSLLFFFLLHSLQYALCSSLPATLSLSLAF